MTDSDAVQQFLNEIRAEHGEIVAHPLMFVSALHNREGCFPVNQDVDFFKRNDIKFVSLPDLSGIPDRAPPMKYVVHVDESGAYRHNVIPNT